MTKSPRDSEAKDLIEIYPWKALGTGMTGDLIVERNYAEPRLVSAEELAAIAKAHDPDDFLFRVRYPWVDVGSELPALTSYAAKIASSHGVEVRPFPYPVFSKNLPIVEKHGHDSEVGFALHCLRLIYEIRLWRERDDVDCAINRAIKLGILLGQWRLKRLWQPAALTGQKQRRSLEATRELANKSRRR